MKKGLLISYILILCLFLEMIIVFILNSNVISSYNDGKYNEKLAEKLIPFTIFEKYISYYNYGNILYKNNDYSEAKIQYEKSLQYRVPKDRVCDIRINLSLSIINSIDTGNTTIEKQLEILKEARNILYEDNCANLKDDSGNSQEAEELEEKIKELEKSLGSSSTEEDDQKDEPDDKEENDIDEKKKEELEERNSGTTENRQEELQNYESLDDYQYYDGKTW